MMKLSEVVEVLSNPEPYGGTAAQQVERRQREIKARKEAVDFILTSGVLLGLEYTAEPSEIDGSVVLFIDTRFEPNGSDGSSGLRVNLNDHCIYDREPR